MIVKYKLDGTVSANHPHTFSAVSAADAGNENDSKSPKTHNIKQHRRSLFLFIVFIPFPVKQNCKSCCQTILNDYAI